MSRTIRYREYDYYSYNNAGVTIIGSELESILPTMPIEVQRLFSWEYLFSSDYAEVASMLILNDSGETKYTFFDVKVSPTNGDSVWYSLRDKPNCYTHESCGVVWQSNAQSTRIGRFIKSLVKPEVLAELGINDSPKMDDLGKKYSVLERLSDCVKLGTNPSYTIDVVRGSDIAEWYRSTTLNNESLGSCMQNEPKSYFDLYVNNPNCALLIVTLDGDLVGRSLLWDNVTHDGIPNRKYCDRYYTVKQHTTPLARAHAESLGYTLNYESISGNLEVTSGVTYRHSRYPYCDTFHYLSSDYRLLSSKSGAYTLDSTCGSLGNSDDYDDDYDDDDDLTYCESCSDLIDDYYTYNGRVLCEECYDSSYPMCEYCNVRHDSDDMTYVSTISGNACESCLSDNPDWLHKCYTPDCDETTYDSDYLTLVTTSDSTQESVCTHCLATHYRYDIGMSAYIPNAQSVMFYTFLTATR